MQNEQSIITQGERVQFPSMVKKLQEAAISASVVKDWARCKMAYKDAFESSRDAATGSTSLLRYYCLNGFCSVLADKSAGPITEEDEKLARSILKDVRESPLVRMTAAQLVSWKLMDERDRERAGHYRRKVVDIYDGSTEAERAAMVFGTHPSTCSTKSFPAGVMMRFLADQERGNLANMERSASLLGAGPAAGPQRAQGSVFADMQPAPVVPPPGACVSGCLEPISAYVSVPAFDPVSAEALRPGGAFCDECLAPKGPRPLPRCERCHLAYYCGEACQHAAWGRHKAKCCPPGSFLPGDRVMIRGLTSRADLNGAVAVLGTLCEDGVRWEARVGGHGLTGGAIRVKPANMARLRPA